MGQCCCTALGAYLRVALEVGACCCLQGKSEFNSGWGRCWWGRSELTPSCCHIFVLIVVARINTLSGSIGATLRRIAPDPLLMSFALAGKKEMTQSRTAVRTRSLVTLKRAMSKSVHGLILAQFWKKPALEYSYCTTPSGQIKNNQPKLEPSSKLSSCFY